MIPTFSDIFRKSVCYAQNGCAAGDTAALSPCQSGFRSRHSTLTALIEATNSWSVNIDNGLVNGVVFIDLKKAFDTIDHDIMLLKLENYGIERSSLTWFKSYLTDRTKKMSGQWSIVKLRPNNLWRSSGKQFGATTFSCLY